MLKINRTWPEFLPERIIFIFTQDLPDPHFHLPDPPLLFPHAPPGPSQVIDVSFRTLRVGEVALCRVLGAVCLIDEGQAEARFGGFGVVVLRMIEGWLWFFIMCFSSLVQILKSGTLSNRG